MSLLSVENLQTHFHTYAGVVRAVDNVSFSIQPGETLGIVGESGSGKSVSVYSLLRLIPMPPGRIAAGIARFDDIQPSSDRQSVNLLSCDEATLRQIRGNRIAFVFQDPMTALNPYLTIGNQVAEPLVIHGLCDWKEARERAVAALTSVGISDAAARAQAYPHQFSGGMRQRVLIAMALITHPALLIADEPTTALDVTVQAQILSLIKERQRELGMAVILITHNLGVVANACDRVLIMYAGRMVESAPCEAILTSPRHPYTEALMQSMPSLYSHGDTLPAIPGMPPDLTLPITGCSFAPRCRHANDHCHSQNPELRSLGGERATACLRVQKGEL